MINSYGSQQGCHAVTAKARGLFTMANYQMKQGKS